MVWAMPVVIVEKERQTSRALGGMRVSMSIGPFAQRSLDEALGLAVSARSVRASEALFEAEACDLGALERAAVAGTVVGIETLWLDAEVLEESERGVEKGDGTLSGFVWQELSEGDPGMIIDGDVKILPASARAVIMAITRDTAAGALDASEFFDVEMNEFAGVSVLVAAQRSRGFQGFEASETVAAQQTRDGGLGDFGATGDLEARQFAATQSQDAGHAERVDGSGGTFGARTAVVQSGRAFGAKASEPLVGAAFADTESGGDPGDGLMKLEDTFDHLGSTQRREPGLTVHVHAAVLGWWLCDNPTSPSPRRMNNLLKLHS